MNEIQKLLDQIIPLDSKRILVSTKLAFDKENYLKTFDESKKQEIVDGQELLNSLEIQINPLRLALRKLQTKYLVEYRGIFSQNNDKYWQTYVEEFYFSTKCEINTFQDGWENYNEIQNSSELLSEIYHFLLNHRFSEFRIVNVKKLD